MYLIILAAGQGTRLRPLTDDKPKCLVEAGGRALLDWQLQVARSSGMDDIAVIRGYMHTAIDRQQVKYFENSLYQVTNMVSTLWCAESVFEKGFIISYGDIVYEQSVLESLLDSEHDISVIVDKGWRPYWEQRFDDVLEDAETLQVDPAGLITSIGQQAQSIDEIDGQYIGLVAFRGNGVAALRELYEQAKETVATGSNPLRGQRSFDQLYMTDILQGLIDAGSPVHQVPVNRGWLEIDSVTDLELANRLIDPDADHLTILR